MIPLGEIIKECKEGDTLICVDNEGSDLFFTLGESYEVVLQKATKKKEEDKLVVMSNHNRPWATTGVIHFIKV